MSLDRMLRASACRCWFGCGKVVIRAQTWKIDEVKKRGERPGTMPLDPGERPRDDDYANSNIAVSAGPAETVRARVLRKGEEPLADEVRMVTHYATCTRYTAPTPPPPPTQFPAAPPAAAAATRRTEQAPTKSSTPIVGGNVLDLDVFRRRRARPGGGLRR